MADENVVVDGVIYPQPEAEADPGNNATFVHVPIEPIVIKCVREQIGILGSELRTQIASVTSNIDFIAQSLKQHVTALDANKPGPQDTIQQARSEDPPCGE